MLKVFKYMINKRNLPLVLLILAGGVFVAGRTLGRGGNPPTKYERILHNVGEYLEQIHYSPKAIDDKFSAEVFDIFAAAFLGKGWDWHAYDAAIVAGV